MRRKTVICASALCILALSRICPCLAVEHLSASQRSDFERKISENSEELKRTPSDALLYATRGQNYKQVGQYALALQDLNKAIQLDGTNGKFYMIRSRVLGILLKNREALSDANRAIQLGPVKGEWFGERAQLKTSFDDADGAMNDYNSAIRLDPSMPILFFSRGYLFADRSDWVKAIQDFDMALSLDPSLTKVRQKRNEIVKAHPEIFKAP